MLEPQLGCFTHGDKAQITEPPRYSEEALYKAVQRMICARVLRHHSTFKHHIPESSASNWKESSGLIFPCLSAE